jgi:Zn-finger nucleic acid-binding protein
MRVDVCAKCGGVFADKALTASMARGADRVVADAVFAFSVGKREWPREGVTAQLPCPECGMPMHREHVAPAVCDIDTCPEHGTWFDAHEATNVARALANARHRRHGG